MNGLKTTTKPPLPVIRPPFVMVISAAFTLLEMMLAVMLIGLTATLVVVNIDRDEDDIARLEARRFAALVRQVQDESILAGYPMAISVDPINNRYRFYLLAGSWQAVEKDNVLRPRIVPEYVTVEINLLQTSESNKDAEKEQDDEADQATAGDKIKGPDPGSMIVVEPTGLISPFIVTFSGGKQFFHIALDAEQNVILSSGEGQPDIKPSQ